MKEIRTIPVERINIERMSQYVLTIINELKDNTYVEGVFYIGCGLQPTVSLSIVYNDYKFDYNYSNEKRNEIIQNSGMDLRIETVAYWRYFMEKRKFQRSEYPIEFMLRYGNILYDRNGNLEKLKQQLENDPEIEKYLDYWIDTCKFETPLQLTKNKN